MELEKIRKLVFIYRQLQNLSLEVNLQKEKANIIHSFNQRGILLTTEITHVENTVFALLCSLSLLKC